MFNLATRVGRPHLPSTQRAGVVGRKRFNVPHRFGGRRGKILQKIKAKPTVTPKGLSQPSDARTFEQNHIENRCGLLASHRGTSRRHGRARFRDGLEWSPQRELRHWRHQRVFFWGPSSTAGNPAWSIRIWSPTFARPWPNRKSQQCFKR
jgi:hypothetical protein